MKIEDAKLARAIINSGAFLNQYERDFLRSVPKQIKKFGHLTSKQTRLLESLAIRTNQAIEYQPAKIKPAAAALMIQDLLNHVKTMSPVDKKTLRIAIITQRKNGIDSVDKNALFALFKRYCT